jgi:hypothetical protein
LVQGYDPLLNPKKEPSPRIMWLIDTASWVLPVLAAILAVGAGVEALTHDDSVAAILGIAGGVISAAGVLATGWASKIRDERMAVAHALGNLSLNIASDAMSRTPAAF